MATQTFVINLVRQFAADVKAEGINLKTIILFGSYARNTQRRWSDIDVALVADEFAGLGFKDIDLFINAKIKKNYANIQVHTFPTLYFKKGDSFIDEIKKKGIEIKI